jgi:hypothetical protein
MYICLRAFPFHTLWQIRNVSMGNPLPLLVEEVQLSEVQQMWGSVEMYGGSHNSGLVLSSMSYLCTFFSSIPPQK